MNSTRPARERRIRRQLCTGLRSATTASTMAIFCTRCAQGKSWREKFKNQNCLFCLFKGQHVSVDEQNSCISITWALENHAHSRSFWHHGPARHCTDAAFG